mmetsp:Transcript_12534/g.36706  ORF Transcript_12534/g.36706 Transcript_12534/m.36706 type:complete len:318 (-) Transcript_12534:25-978(-)
MAYSLVGRSAPMAADDSDDDDQWQDGGEDDVRERTAWQDKHSVAACFGCGKTFGALTNRHHHCRECGRVVCGDCSPWKDRVKGYAAPQRTCNECHDSLTTKETLKREGMNLLRMCPCFRWVKRQVAKHQKRSLLYDGAMFSRRRAAKEALQKAADKISSFAGSLFGSKSETSNDGDDVGFERVRVYLRPDGTCLDVNDSDELIYLHDVQCVKSVDKDGLRLLGIAGVPLFEGTLPNGKTRDAWVAALQEAIAEATEKPPPSRSSRRPKSRLEMATRHSQRERELADRKKAADARKSKYRTGGMKYTAVAMANRGAVV